jgi:hypothetical protein
MVKFIISCDVFGGFECVLNPTEFNTIEELVTEIKNHLILYLSEFYILKEQVKKKNYHIHTHTLKDLQILHTINNKQDVYVCSHVS